MRERRMKGALGGITSSRLVAASQNQAREIREVSRLENLGSLDQRSRLLKKHSSYLDHFLPPDRSIMSDRGWVETLALGVPAEDFEDWLRLLVSQHYSHCGMSYEEAQVQRAAAEKPEDRNRLPSNLEIATYHRAKREAQKQT